jgi:hypothetical protein
MLQGGLVAFSWIDIYEPPTFTQSLDLAFVITGSCCIGIRGDLDGNGSDATILDLNFLVNKIFRAGPPPACREEGDVDGNGTSATILDLNYLVNKIFRLGPLPGPCL